MHRHAPRPWLFALALAGCDPGGVLGAPCERGSDCADGLMCDQHSAGGSCQQPHDDHVEPAPRGCEIETRDDSYALGLTKHGAWAEVSFVDASPAPPSRGDNVWTLRVRDHAGVALADLDVTVDPFMPDHFHGTAIRCDVTPSETPGDYVLEPLNLFMPGLWEVTVSLQQDERHDDVLFSFCVDP